MDEPAFEHPEDDLLEMYALRKLGAPELWTMEEHLTVCGKCRRRLQATEEFVSAVRSAARRIEKNESSRFQTRHLHTMRWYWQAPKSL